MTRTGKCLCGAVTFSAGDIKSEHGACHCGMCRRWCGGAPFFTVDSHDVVFENEANIVRYASSSWAERGFCATCGTTLFYYLAPAKMYALAVGAFDDTTDFRLTEEIFIDDKPDGYALVGDHPRLTGEEAVAKFAPKP